MAISTEATQTIRWHHVRVRLCPSFERDLSNRGKKLLNEYRDDLRLGILAWSLGKFGHWNLLVDLSDEVEDIERKQQKEQYKRMGLSSELVRSLTERGYNGAYMRL